MKKLAEKVALVAQICITLVFVITTILYMTNLIPQQADWHANGVMSVLMIVLGAIYVLLSGYLLYMHFSEREALRKILLFCDSESATHADAKVVSNIANSCAKQVHGLSLRKLKIRSDEKGGFVATAFVKVSVENVAESVNKMRFLLVDSFKNTLGLTFNTINFNIERIRGTYKPNVSKAEEQAKELQTKQENVAETYVAPVEDNVVENQQNEVVDENNKETVDA